MARIARFHKYLGHTYPTKVFVVYQKLKFNSAPVFYLASLALDLFESNHTPISNCSCTELHGDHQPQIIPSPQR